MNRKRRIWLIAAGVIVISVVGAIVALLLTVKRARRPKDSRRSQSPEATSCRR